MKTIFSTAMQKAVKLTQSQHVIDATRVIQRALAGRNPAHAPDQQPASNLRLMEPKAGARPAEIEPPTAGNASAGWRQLIPKRALSRASRPLGEVLTQLRRDSPEPRPWSDAPPGTPDRAAAAGGGRVFDPDLQLCGRLSGL